MITFDKTVTLKKVTFDKTFTFNNMNLNEKRKKGWIVLLINIISWGILFCIPLFFKRLDRHPLTFFGYIGYCTIIFSFITVFYINYMYLIKRFIFSGKIAKFIFLNILLITSAILAVHVILGTLPRMEDAESMHKVKRAAEAPELVNIIMFMLRNVATYMLVVGLSVGIKMTASWYKSQDERKELERSKYEAELQNLKAQLNPHFLFNTLNNIYSLISFDSEKAQAAVHNLSRLLRYVLYESCSQQVILGDDIDFIKDYISLMKIRITYKTEINVKVNVANPGLKVAPLMFISLIENAFKHGVSSSTQSKIDITITENNGTITCTTANRYFPKNDSDRSGSGIGIINLKKRLQLLYPNRYCFESHISPDGGQYISKLEIKLI